MAEPLHSRRRIRRFPMTVSASVKPALWGVVGGAIAAMVVGFAWGGWVTGGKAGVMAANSAEAAIVIAFTPLCVASAEQRPDQRELLKKESSWSRDAFVIKAGWVKNVTEKYQREVARVCATAIVEAMDASAKPK
jgi:hypothetical protein